MNQQLIKSMTGYKATNTDLTCHGHAFELGKWYEVTGELEECKNGFHFCEQLSGVFIYYPTKDSRVFKIEAEDILDTPKQSGSDYKRVCRRIKLVEEVKFKDDTKNTGDGNTGYWNTGYWNTGNWNTGNWNTGNWNTGNWNTGNWNTGWRNTGDSNTGDFNTGAGNATNYSSGFFEIEEPKVSCFGNITDYTRKQFCEIFPNYELLCRLLMDEEPIEFEKFKNIPNITPEKLKKLHEKHLEAFER